MPQKYRQGSNIVMLEPELVEYFPDSASVNEALKSLAKLIKKHKNKKAKQIGPVDIYQLCSRLTAWHD